MIVVSKPKLNRAIAWVRRRSGPEHLDEACGTSEGGVRGDS